MDHIKDTINIYEYYSSNYGYINILSKGDLLKTIEVKNSKTKTYDIYSNDNIELYLEKTINKENLTYKYDGIEELNKDTKKGDKLGTVTILNSEKALYTYDVYLDTEIEYYNYPLYIGIGIGVTIITAIIVLVLRKIVMLNIPIIGEYIADIVDIVQRSR